MTPDKFQQSLQQGLAALDVHLARINRELASLTAARPADADVISVSVKNAQQTTESIRSTLTAAAAAAGDAPPKWETRQELESAAEKIVERLRAATLKTRRERLQAVAGSLHMAQVLHPKWRKVVPALDALRVEAATQLEAAAASTDPPELPGPEDSGAWLAWAWDLPPEQVEESLTTVRAAMPALAKVVLEIDPSQWNVVAEAIAFAEPVSLIQKKQPEAPKDSPSSADVPSALPVDAGPESGPSPVLPSESWIDGPPRQAKPLPPPDLESVLEAARPPSRPKPAKPTKPGSPGQPQG